MLNLHPICSSVLVHVRNDTRHFSCLCVLLQPLEDRQVHVTDQVLQHGLEERDVFVQVIESQGQGNKADQDEEVKRDFAHPWPVP